MQKTPPKAYFATVEGESERLLVFDYTQIHRSNSRPWYSPSGINNGRSWYRPEELSDLVPAYVVDATSVEQMHAIWDEFYSGVNTFGPYGPDRMKRVFEALAKKTNAPEIPEEPPVWSTRLDVNGEVWGRIPGHDRARWTATGHFHKSWEDLYPTLVKEDK